MCPCDDSWGSQKYKSSHRGLDFGWLNKYGANRPVKAWKSGVVVQCGQITETINGKKYYPTVVVLKHEDEDCVWITRYWHLVKGSCKVEKGQQVKQGDILGKRGNTGYSNGVHLHFELWKCPKGYSYSAKDYSQYAINPVSHTYLFEGQVFHADSDFTLKVKPVEPEIVKPIMVARDTQKHQVEVIASSLRVRTEASTDANVYCMCPKGIFNVLAIAETSKYIWYMIEENRWIATNEGKWTLDRPIELTEEEKMIMSLKEQLAQAEENADVLQEEINKLTTKLEAIKVAGGW